MHPASPAGREELPAGLPDDLTRLVDDHLAQLRFAREPGVAGLQEAMRRSLQPPHERIRPVLALATARALGHDPREVLPLAAAVELIHLGNARQDDHVPVRFGQEVGLLAAEALFAEAFRLVLSEQPGEPAHVMAALACLTEASGVNGRAGGRYIDLLGLADARSVGLKRLHRLKTGALMRASVESVLHLHGVSGSTLEASRRFADELGLLLQIVDDILDGTDARPGKVTYVSRFGLPWARTLAEETYQAARAALARAFPHGAPELGAIADYALTRTS